MNNPRRIVADVGADGASRVAFDEAVLLDGEPARIRLTNLWLAPQVANPNETSFDGGFVPFTMAQTHGNDYAMTLVEYAPGFGRDDPGMHSTDTVDHFYVVAGEIVMVLDVGDAVLRSGDTGIVRGARHGWRNDGATTAKLVFFVLPAKPPTRKPEVNHA